MHDEDKKRALKLALHEVGHYVVGEVLGFPVSTIKLEVLPGGLDGGRRGGSEIEVFREVTNLAEAKDLLKDRIKVLYAGCVAETIKDGKLDEASCRSCLRLGTAQDFAKIRELLYVLRCFEGASVDYIEVTAQKLSSATGQIVSAEMLVILGVAETLAKQIKKLSTEYVFERADILAISEFAKRFPTATI